ncbi:hypothetical protein FACS1894214_2300 [Planctomycetales bacterium]|nr:hypothetical protein FACS1894214_2300 [Planctomycetales bacterium]
MQHTELTIHPELETLLPRLTETEFAGLEESILKDGCLSALVVWNSTLIDGQHRYEICRMHQIPFSVQSVVFESLGDAKLWIWKHQENRRNLTAFQRAEIALMVKDAVASKAKDRQIRKPANSVPQTFAECKETRKELADAAQVSHTTLNKAEYIVQYADEETKAKLRRGEKGTSINKEYKRLKEQAAAKPNQTVSPAAFPPCPHKEEPYFPKTTLKDVDQGNPHSLVAVLFEIFRKGYVEEMIPVAMKMLWDNNRKDAVKEILAQLNKQYARKK